MKYNTEFVVYVPEVMWGGLWDNVWAKAGIRITKVDCPVGDERDRREPEEIVKAVIEDASKELGATQIPIIVLPIALVPKFRDSIEILGPAFKTKDDIFLFVGSEKQPPLGGRAVVGGKGKDMTTTVVAKEYAQHVIENGADPVFNEPRKYMPGQAKLWPYSISLGYFLSEKRAEAEGEAVDLEHERKLRVKRVLSGDWHGLIATGSDLATFWDKPDWIAAVNLNAWICRKLGVPYFTRTVFCSLPNYLGNRDPRARLTYFWKTFGESGYKWLEERKAVGENLPDQVPSITENTDGGRLAELAMDICCCVDFMRIAYQTCPETYSSCKEISFSDFKVCTDGIMNCLKLEAYRQCRREKLKDRIFQEFILKRLAEPSVEQNREELRRQFYPALRKFVGKSLQLVDDSPQNNPVPKMRDVFLIALHEAEEEDREHDDLSMARLSRWKKFHSVQHAKFYFERLAKDICEKELL